MRPRGPPSRDPYQQQPMRPRGPPSGMSHRGPTMNTRRTNYDVSTPQVNRNGMRGGSAGFYAP